MNVTFLRSDGRSLLIQGNPIQNVAVRDVAPARVWIPPSGMSAARRIPGLAPSGIFDISPDGQAIVTAGADHTVRIWSTADGAAIGQPMPHPGDVTSARFSPDGKTVITTGRGAGKPVRLWSAADGSLIADLQPTGGYGVAKDAADALFSPDGKKIVATCADGSGYLWHKVGAVWNGSPRSVASMTGEMIQRVEISTDGSVFLIVGSQESGLWDGEGHKIAHIGYSLKAVRLSPDGRSAITINNDGTIDYFDRFAPGNSIQVTSNSPHHHPGEAERVRFSPDGKLFATYGGNTAQLWRLADLAPVGNPIRLQGRITDLTVSPDETTLAVASDDRTVRFWNTSDGSPVGQPLTHDEAVFRVVFLPGSETVLTACADGTVRRWAVPRPIGGDPIRLELWAEAATGLELGEDGTIRFLVPDAWQERRRRLDALGGLPDPW